MAGIPLFFLLLYLWQWASLLSIVAALAAAWVVVAHEYMQRINIVCEQMLRGRFDPSAAPEPASQRERGRLAMVSKRRTGNLVVFEGNVAFVGSGDRLSKEHLVIDVSRGRAEASKNGKSPKPSRFTNQDVHAAIISAMEKIGLADLRVEERLFVNGKHIKDNGAVLPRTKEPPSASVSPEVLQEAVLHPTPDARVYVCVEMPSWQGQLVVTLFTRAVHVGGSLYIEWRFHVLPPVRSNFQYIDNRWCQPRKRIIAHVCRSSVRRTGLALFGAPVRMWMDHRYASFMRKYERDQEYAIDHGQVFDYGAARSIREDASGFARQHYFLGRDETMFVLLAQEKPIRAISVFLQKKNVDTGQLKTQVEVIVKETNKFFSVHLGDVSNSNVAIGKKAQASGVPPRED